MHVFNKAEYLRIRAEHVDILRVLRTVFAGQFLVRLVSVRLRRIIEIFNSILQCIKTFRVDPYRGVRL